MGTSDRHANGILRKQKNIIKHLLKSYDVSPGKTHVGIIIRSNPSVISLELGQIKNRDLLYKQIDKIEVPEPGDLADALVIATNGVFSPFYGARSDFRKSLVVFVDGNFDSNKAALKSSAIKLKNNGVNMIVIDVSTEIDPRLMGEKDQVFDAFFFPPLLEDLDIALYPVVKAMQPGASKLVYD